MTNYSAQRVAFAAASAAALATATAAVYYVYRRRQQDSQRRSRHPVAVERSKPENAEVQPNSKDVLITHSFAWAVFWDIENVPVPRTVSATQFVQALRKTLAAHRNHAHPDSILRIHAITNVRRTSVQLRHDLQANGVNVTHVESKGRKDAADKALITEICLITREHPVPFGICLISGDGDFSYPVSRLTALGYATVVVAPTRQSFSTLLEAVPDAVIPLHSVLEGYDDPSVEPHLPRRDAAAMRRQNQQTVRHPMPIGHHPTPLHVSRRPDKRVARRKRRERILPQSALAERDEDDSRRLSSDDDRSSGRTDHLRMARRPPQMLTPYTDHDTQVPVGHVHKQYVGSVGTSPVSHARLIPVPIEHVQIQGIARQRGDHPTVDKGLQHYRQPTNGSGSHLTNGPLIQTSPTKKPDADSMENSHSNLGDRKRITNGPRVRFAGDTILPDTDEQIRPQDGVPREKGANRRWSQSAGRRNNSEPKKQTSSLGSRNSSEEVILGDARWFYSGIRALPFFVLLTLIGFSVLFSSLRVALRGLEALQLV